MSACGREAEGSGPCILEADPNDPLGHWGGCSWESEDAWQPVPNNCPVCHAGGCLEVRTTIPDGSGTGMPQLHAEYRCHSCGATGAATPAQ